MAHSRSSSKTGPHVFTNIPFVNYSSITDPCGGDGLERWCGHSKCAHSKCGLERWRGLTLTTAVLPTLTMATLTAASLTTAVFTACATHQLHPNPNPHLNTP